MPLDYNQFAEKIKAKYPQYKDVDNLELTKKMIAKYPEYKNQVTLDVPKKKESTSKDSHFYSKALKEVGLSDIDQPKKQKASVSSGSKPVKEKQSDIYTGYPGKETKKYRLDNSTGKPVWMEYSNTTFKGGKQIENFDKTITDPARVASLNKHFGVKASASKEEEVFVGYPGKELNEYRVRDGEWQRRLPKATTWEPLHKKETVETLNYYFGKKVDYNAAKAKYSGVTEGIEQVKQKELSDNLKLINSKIIGKEEEDVVPLLKNSFPGFKFIESGAMADQMEVIAPNGEKTIISLDNWTHDDDLNQALLLQDFIRANSNKELVDATTKMLGTEATLKRFDPQPVDIKIRLGEGEGDVQNLLDIEGSYGSTAQPNTDIVTATQKAKEARAEYFQKSKENFVDTKDRMKYALRTGSTIDDKAAVAAYANLEMDKSVIDSSNNYMNDISDAGKDLKKQYDDLNEYSENIKAKYENGEITLDQLNNEYIPQINKIADGLESKRKNIQSSVGDIYTFNNQIKEAAASNLIIKESTGSFGGGLAYNFSKGLTDVLRLGAGLMGADSENTKRAQEDFIRTVIGSGTTAEYMASEDRSDLTKVLFSLSQTAGNIVGSGGLGGAASKIGASKLGVSAAEFSPFYATSYYELKDQFDAPEFKDVSDGEKVLMSTLYGFAVGALEKFGVSKSLSKSPLGQNFTNMIIKNTFKDLPKDAGKEMIELAIENNIKKKLAATGVNTVGAMFTELSTEATQEGFGIGLKEAYDAVKGKDYFKSGTAWDITGQILEAGYLGAIGGGIMHTAPASLDLIKNAKKINNIDQLKLMEMTLADADMRSAIFTDIKSKIATGELSKAEGQEQISAIKQASGIFSKLPDNLSDEQKMTSVNLLTERTLLQEKIEGKDEALVSAQKERINAINEELKTISQNATKENNVEQQKDTTEGSKVEYQGADQGQQEVGTTEGTVGQTTQQKADTGDSTVASRSVKELGTKATQEVNTYIAELGSNERIGGTVDSVMAKMNNAEYINDSEINSTIDTIFSEVESINNDANYSDETKKALSDKLMNIAEQLDNYEFRTKTETIAVTQRGTAPVAGQAPTTKISAEKFFEGQQAEVNGVPATFKSNKGRTEAVMDNGETVVLDTPTMKINEGDFEFDDAGALTAVTVTDRFGTTAKFTGDIAMDLAIKQRENEIGTVEQADFDTVYKEVETKYVKETSKSKEATNSEKVATLRAQEQQELNEAIPNIEEYRVNGEIDKESMPADVLAKYNEIYDKYDAKITPLLPATKTATTTKVEKAKPTVAEKEVVAEVKPAAKTIEQEVEEIGQLVEGSDIEIDRIANTISDKRMAKVVARSAKALSRIAPGVKFKIHATDAEYRLAVDESTEGASSNGTFDPATNTVHVNLENANNRTVAHEVFHAILLNKVRTNKDATAVTNKMIEAISSKLDGNSDLKKYLDDFASNYEENIQSEEKLSELVGILAENYMNAPTSVKDVIYRWIDRLAKMFGLDPFKRNEVYDMLNTIARKTAKGKVIKESEVKVIPSITDKNGNLKPPSKKSVENLKNRKQNIVNDTKANVSEGNIVSTRLPKSNDVHSNNEYIVSISDLEKIASKDAGAEAQYIKIAKEISGYNISKIKNVENIKDAKKVISEFKESVKLNLKWLHDSFGNDVRDISKLWYDGANKICNNISSNYNYSLEQVSGVMAVLSPQMDWFRNLSLGERVIDIYSKQQDSVFDDKMINYVNTATSGTGKNKVPLFKEAKDIVSRVKGKKLSELNKKDKAYFIRVFDEVYNPREYNNISPNGEVNGLVRKSDGTPGACGWGAFPTIEKSISILQDGSIENISSNLGNMHKVRNFFNNISNPNDVNAVTIDTHAVAAALLLPLSGSSTQVLYNFGGAGNVNTGMNGTYPVYADAYRELAKELNLLPREVQSITWEAVRGLFKATFKSNKSNEANVNKIWDDYSSGLLSLDEAHSRIESIAGGISKPVWYEYMADDNVKSLDKNSAGLDQANLDNEEKTDTTKRKQKPVAGNKLFNEPLKDASTIADRYAKKSGITMQEVIPVTSLDKENSKAISDEFEKMKDDPTNPEVSAAYNKMAEETIAQYKEIVKDGYFVEINNEEPYSSSEDMIKDLKENKRFKVFSTESGFGDTGITEKQRSENPLLKDSGFKDVNGETLLVNDVFRFVHDFFGHAKFGNSFGPIGEENAWMIHSVMYSPLARRAMTSETRGQNSYVNFSGVNEEAFRLRDKARALRQEGKIEQANKLVEKVYDIMKFADQKVGLMPEWVSGTGNIDGAVKVRKQKPSNINAVIKLCKENGFSNEAITKYLKGKGFSDEQINNSLAPYIAKENAKNDFNIEYSRLIDEGATEENAFNEAMDNVVYKMDDDILREEVARELMKSYGKKIKSAPRAEKIIGKAKPITITTNDVKGLNDIIKREAKAAKDKKKQIDEVIATIAAQVKDLVTKGSISIRQMSAIINALKNTNFDNQVMVDRFMDYVLKVVSNADYIERVNKGLNFKKAIKRNLNGKANPFVSVAKSFTELNPKWVVDINKYNEISELVFNSVKPTRITKDAVNFKKEADIEVIAKYIAEEQENHLKIYEANVRDRYERITEEKSEGKTIEEMNNILLNLKDKKDYSSQIAAELKEKLDEYKKMVTNDDLAEVKAAVNVDLNLIDNKMAISILDALDTYFANGSNASLKAIMATYGGIVAVNEFNGKAKALRMLGSKKIGRVQNEQFTNINMLSKRLFRGQNAGQAFLEAIGFNNLVQGSNRAERQSVNKQNEYTKKFKNVKNFNTAENIFERNVIAWLRRRDVNANEQDSFNKRLKLLKDSVDVLRKSGTATEIAKADLYEKVFKKLGLYDDNVSIENVLGKSEKFNIDAVDFVTEMWSDIYPQLSDTSLGVYNTMLANDINYTPDKFTNLDSSIPSEFDVESSGFMSFNSNYTLDKNSAGVLMETTRPSKLPTNMYIDLDFDRNMFRSYKLALNDMYTAEAIRHTNAFLKSDKFAEIIPTAEDRRIVASAIQGYVSAKKGKKYIERSEMNFFNSFLDALGGFGAARALAGFSQFANQWATANVFTLINAGEYMRPLDFRNKDVLSMIANSGLPISNVGIEALTTIENADKELEKAGIVATVGGVVDKYTLSYLKKSNAFLLKQLLANPDRFARVQAFAAYYRKSMAQQGLKADFKAPMNEKAAKYAQSMIDANMDVSDTEMRGQFFKSKNAYVKIIKQVFFPFSTFSMNQRNRVWSDAAVLVNPANEQERITALRSLAAFSAEFFTYNAIRYGAGLLIIRGAVAALGLDDEEEEEKIIKKYEENLMKSIKSSSITDVLSPTPVLDEATLSVMNKMMPMFGIGTPTEEEFQKYIDGINEERIYKGKEKLTEDEVALKKDKFMLDEQFQFYIDNEKSTGMLGIQFSKIQELYDIVDAYYTGKYSRERFAGGGYEEVSLSDDAKESLKYIALLKLEGTLLGPRETDQIANRMFKIVKDTKTLTEAQKSKYDVIKKDYEIDPYKLSLIKTTMKTENVLKEIEYIESTGGLTEKQSKEYAKLRAFGAIDGWGLDDIRKGKTAKQIIASRQ